MSLSLPFFMLPISYIPVFLFIFSWPINPTPLVRQVRGQQLRRHRLVTSDFGGKVKRSPKNSRGLFMGRILFAFNVSTLVSTSYIYSYFFFLVFLHSLSLFLSLCCRHDRSSRPPPSLYGWLYIIHGMDYCVSTSTWKGKWWWWVV